MKTILAIFVIAGVAAGGAAYYTKFAGDDAPTVYETAPIERGELVITISATGTLEPEEVVDVGAQVAGKIETFGRDPANPDKPIDYCSEVREGTVLANIDPTYYQARVAQAEAELKRAEAELLQYQAKLEQTQREWKRAEVLRRKEAIAETDYDLAESDYHVAQANIALGEASIRQAEAALRMAKTDYGYTVIRSPVDGTIIARRVNVGQTVVASLNAPSLFLIAKDLRRMQVWASVNEADIGRIRVGMPARFTVDAFPGETFHGSVTQIRLNAQITQNIVLYTVVVTTDNADLKLLPYLTANLLFEVDRRDDVLLIPNAALRWKPKSVAEIASNAMTATETEEAVGDEALGTPEDSMDKLHRLWVADGALVRPLDVIVGASDGAKTRISGPGVEEGIRVVIGEGGEAAAADDQTTNPFLPKFPKKGPRGPRP